LVCLKCIIGRAIVPYTYNLTDYALVKISVSSETGAQFCVNGKSVRWFLPDYYCRLNLCSYIGYDMCNILEKAGTHTVDELVKKLNFNPNLRFPEPPCFLGLVCLTDFFGGKYHIEFALDFKNVTIAHWKVPMSRKYLQLAEFVDDDDDDVD
uniref:DUF4773 domain-containing protein n=1 Tax=Enterobius vermicularis TaxID=51028 RepID=A0A0N4VRE2_ENTVE